MMTKRKLVGRELDRHIERLIRNDAFGVLTEKGERDRIADSPITHVWVDARHPDLYEED